MTHLLLVEPKATGHHFALYAKQLLKEASKRRWKITLITMPNSIRHPSFNLIQDEIKNNINIVLTKGDTILEGSGIFSLLIGQLKLFLSIKEAYKKLHGVEKPDIIYVINLDHFDKIMSILGSPFGKEPFMGMLMGPKFHRSKIGIGPRSRSDLIYTFLFKRLYKIGSLKKIAIIDKLFIDSAREIVGGPIDKLFFVPDFGEVEKIGNINDKWKIKERLGISLDSFVIVLYGSLSLRKGVKELLDCLYVLHKEHKKKNIIVHLAGVQDDTIKQLLTDERYRELVKLGCLIISNFFHGEEQEKIVFNSADMIWLGYVSGSYGSSGVLYQAASIGVPVIATKFGLIGKLVQEYNAGLLIDPANSISSAKQIVGILSNPSLIDFYQEGLKALYGGHNPSSFTQSIYKELMQAI